jgi:Ni,Fe-hydrogenase III small subunit
MTMKWWKYIPDLRAAVVPEPFRGRPVISGDITAAEAAGAQEVCPTGAIALQPVMPGGGTVACSLDLGRCVFCRECEFAVPGKIRFTNDHRLATNIRERLIIYPGRDEAIRLDPGRIRTEIRGLFRHALKLRQVSAAGDNSTEMELNASGNVNFDFGRFGVEFVASPRHSDGVVVTGPVSRNMSDALRLTYEAVPAPKIIILAGTDAISGGIFADSPALDRDFLTHHPVDLYVPGNPSHPLTFINGVLDLVGRG